MEEKTDINALSIIESMNNQAIQNTMAKIEQFQKIIQQTLKEGHDYGTIPGTNKPTLYKPGGEKISMLMGLRSEFEVVESKRDFDTGFFQYQVRCKLLKGDTLITEGLGACNTKEKKYVNQDPFTLDNTVLKMAKKRAFVDAVLLVASLSDIFMQDMEDLQDLSQREQTETMTATDATNMKVTFGKHKGKTLGDVLKEAPDYIEWLALNAKEVVMKKACEQLLQQGNKPLNKPTANNSKPVDFSGTPLAEDDFPPFNESDIPAGK